MPAFLHIVHFWLKEGLSEQERQDVLAGIRSLADSPNVSRLSVRVPAGTPRDVVDNSYDFQLVCEFDSPERHDAYQSPDDAVHQQFVRNHQDKWTKVTIYDSLHA